MNKIAHEMLNFISASTTLNDRLISENKQLRKQASCRKGEAEKTANTLISQRIFSPSEKSAVIAKLQDPVGAYEILEQAAEKLAAMRDEHEKLANQLGSSVQRPAEKLASSDDPFVGARNPRSDRECDRVFMSILRN